MRSEKKEKVSEAEPRGIENSVFCLMRAENEEKSPPQKKTIINWTRKTEKKRNKQWRKRGECSIPW